MKTPIDFEHGSPERALLARAVVGEPPMGTRPEHLLLRARRREQRLRALTVASAAAGVVTLAISVVTISGSFDSDVAPASPGSAVTPTSRPPATEMRTTTVLPSMSSPSTAASTAPPPGPPSNERAAELTDVLAGAKVLPAGLMARKIADRPWGALHFYVNQECCYKASADLFDGDVAVGNLTVDIMMDQPGRTASCVDAAERPGGASGCTALTLPDGTPAVAQRFRDGSVVHLHVWTIRPDGTAVIAYAGNITETVAGGSPMPAPPEPPLGVDELMRIVSLPELRY